MDSRNFTTPMRTSDRIRIDSYFARDAPTWGKNPALRTDSGSRVRLMARRGFDLDSTVLSDASQHSTL